MEERGEQRKRGKESKRIQGNPSFTAPSFSHPFSHQQHDPFPCYPGSPCFPLACLPAESRVCLFFLHPLTKNQSFLSRHHLGPYLLEPLHHLSLWIYWQFSRAVQNADAKITIALLTVSLMSFITVRALTFYWSGTVILLNSEPILKTWDLYPYRFSWRDCSILGFFSRQIL